jgi:hypothetical protein
VPCELIGTVDVLDPRLSFSGLFDFELAELREAWTATLPALFG